MCAKLPLLDILFLFGCFCQLPKVTLFRLDSHANYLNKKYLKIKCVFPHSMASAESTLIHLTCPFYLLCRTSKASLEGKLLNDVGDAFCEYTERGMKQAEKSLTQGS